VYSNEQSAKVAGHRQHGYVVASIRDSRWFRSKDAFMAAMCQAFERLWEEMKVGSTRPDGAEDQGAGENDRQ
jgi:hypothetical protein